MARLAERLSGLRAGMLLSDRHARILRRWVAPDSGILAEMDRVFSVVGSSGSERFIGTNGIGTVVEDHRAHIVVGPEHFAESLSSFTCVGAPIHHPLTRKFEGIITLNGDVEAASPLLIPLITSTAQEIEQGLLSQASVVERMLLDTFLTANRSGAAVAVVGEDVFIAGPRTLRLLEGIDHALIWQQISHTVSLRQFASPVVVGTGSNLVALRCSPLRIHERLVGALFEVTEKTGPPTSEKAASRPGVAHGASATSPAGGSGRSAIRLGSWKGAAMLPGRSATWVNVLHAAALYRSSAVPLIVSGEQGTGKVALLRAMFDSEPGREGGIVVLDCTTAAEDRTGWLDRFRSSMAAGQPVIVLRHLGALEDGVAAVISAFLDGAEDLGSSPRVVATSGPLDALRMNPAHRRLVDQISVGRVELPALRERGDDIKDLIAHISGRYSPHAPLQISQGALRALERAPWPGNIRQLETVVRGLIVSAGMQEVSVEMLPPDLRAYSNRRALTAMEQMELDAILSTITRSKGNKVIAARMLGISRSTLYRKMHSYWLEPDKHFF